MSVKNIPHTPNSVRVVISNEVTYTNILTGMNTAITGLGWTLWDSVDNWIPGSPISFTATISGTAMTVSAVSAGALAVGQTVVGSGVTSNSVITVAPTSQLTGAYTLSQSSTVGSATAMSVVSSNASPMFLRVYRAINADASTYKYFIIWYDIRKQAFWTGTCESWDATNHVATNLAWNNNGSFVQNYDIKDSYIWVSATARHIVIWPFILGEPGLWTGVFEFERSAPEDTAANAAPCWAWTNSVIIGTPFADGTVVQHVAPSKTMFAFPRTQDGLTGAAAAGTYAPVTNRGSFPPSYPSGTVRHGGASFSGFIGAFNGGGDNTVLTVQNMNAGTIVNGSLIRGSGVVPGTRIVSFGTGTGQTGTYNVNIAQNSGALWSTNYGAWQFEPMTSGADPNLLHLGSAHNSQYGWVGATSDTSFRSVERSFVSPISVNAIGKNMPFGRMYNVSVTKPIGSALEVTQTTLDSSGGWASQTGSASDTVILPMNGGSTFPYFNNTFGTIYQGQNNRMHNFRITTPSFISRTFLLGDYIYASCYSSNINGGIWRLSVSSILTPTALNALSAPFSTGLNALSPTWTQIYANTNGVNEMIFDGERSIYAMQSFGSIIIKIDTETLSVSTLTSTITHVYGAPTIDNKYLYVNTGPNLIYPMVAMIDLASFTQTSSFTATQTSGGGYATAFTLMTNYSGHAYAVQLSQSSTATSNVSYVYTIASATGTPIPITTNSNNAYSNFTAINGGYYTGNAFNAGCHILYMDPCTSAVYYLKSCQNQSNYPLGIISRVSSSINPTSISTLSYVVFDISFNSVGFAATNDPFSQSSPQAFFQGFIKGRFYFKGGWQSYQPVGRVIFADPNNATSGVSTAGLTSYGVFSSGGSPYWLEPFNSYSMFTNGPRMCVAFTPNASVHLIKNIYSMHNTEGEVTARLLVKA